VIFELKGTRDANAWFSSRSDCPVCGKILDRDIDIKKVSSDQNLHEDSHNMALWGLDPLKVLEISAKAIKFFNYQKKQEVSFHQHLIRQRDLKLENGEKEISEKNRELENTISSLNSKLKQMQHDLDMRTKAYNSIDSELQERSRQCKQYEV
jgi:hypothetical protein